MIFNYSFLKLGIPLVHYSWVYACLCHVQQIISDSMYSNALLPYEGYLLPSGASFLHPYYVFTVKIPDVGPLNGYVVLNLAGDVWDAVLRAAGAEVCSKMYPYGVNAAIQCRIGCTLCPHTARPLKMDSLASAGVPPLRGRTQRMLAMQMLDWYCCTCSDSASPSNRRNGIALGMQYNTSSSTHSRIKPVQSPLVKDYSEQRPDLILFDPYTICAGGHAPTAVGPRHHQPHQAAFTPEQHSLGLKRSTIVSGGSVSMLSPNDHKALSPEADSVLRRLKQLSELRLKFSGVSGGVCPPRIVSIDWVVHVIGLGDFVPFDASRNFSLPADVLRHPIVIKSSGSGDDRYIVDDVVFYDARTTTSCSINPFQIASSRDTAEKGFITRELRMGRILRFDCNECGTVLKLRPLYFQKETIDKAGAIYKDWDDGCGSEGNGSCSESSHNGSSDEDEILSGEDNDDVDRTLKLKRRLFFLKDEFVSKDQLCGRPVVISAAAYNDLIYPQYDETTYASTEFYESCYDGSLYKRSKRLLKKLQCRINADNERYYGKASQDY